MRGVKRVVSVLITLLVMGGVLAFVLENQQSVALSFLGWTAPQAPISIFMTLALLVGMIVGPLVGLAFRLNRSPRSKRLAP
ncbi:lipopolysaccharide assembly protein LapA domain-containing protein [Pseudomonas sp. SDO5522_S412]